MTFAFHISREARERYGITDELFTLTGNAILPDFAAGRRLAQRMNASEGRAGDPALVVQAGQLNAMGLLDEILHAAVAMYREQVNPRAMAIAERAVASRVGEDAVQKTLETFAALFPTADATRDDIAPTEYLAGETDGVPNREIVLEELLMLWLANANPAFERFRELFDEASLVERSAYRDVIAGLVAHFATQSPFGPDDQTLVDLLRAPALAVPDSIAGQLRFVRERWTFILARFGDRLVTQLDVLAEEEAAVWRVYHPGGAGGDAEDAARRASRAWLLESGWGGGDADVERFSVDRDWMPRLVLIAKSAFVWLDQLSKRYGRHIGRLDEIPDEALDELARRGFSGLWLIGLWQRSRASQTIKQLRGNPEAVASAYSLDDYRIADDLGGEGSFENLKARAWSRGLRIASDMVPNHMGVDSQWVVEHPDWFMAVPDPPYPSYSFSGPDLSNDGRVGIQIEDHYFDNTDAAVVFKRWDRASGETRFIYHGNDGTSMPWNDTAQLDYLKPEVREAVIQAILGVARRSPVIRFDAAMTLAKRHIERLWYPEPGHAGGIPSRAEHAIPKEAFERAMPVEFWREVVDRIASEVPDTLLLAEAFWLMEGYFVRTLGMHRVYNSAFMNMLRDEKNAEYRAVIRNTIEFDPEILKRYVNFMNNPDERTAVEQFGKGDKYFGVATLMATLPGLPMFGHGQVEGFTEKYGMEYRRAYWDEQPDQWLVDRHDREIAPLLHRRHLFAEVDDFLLYDLVRDDGTVDENVYAYSNRGGGERSLVVFNNGYASTSGWIRESAAYSARTSDGGRELRRRTLGDGLGLRDEDGWYVALRDSRTGLEALHAARDVRGRGLQFDLPGYACRVLVAIRDLEEMPGRPWGRLAGDLAGRAVPSLDDALRDLLLRPVHEPIGRLLSGDLLRGPADIHAADPTPIRAEVDKLVRAAGGLVETRPQEGVPAGAEGFDPADATERMAADLATGITLALGPAGPDIVAIAWLLFDRLPPALGQPAGRAAAWIDEWRLGSVIAAAAREAGADEGDAWRTVDAVKALLALPAWDLDLPLEQRVRAILGAWLADESTARVLRVNVHRDVRWFNREAFEAFAGTSARVAAIRRRLAGQREATAASAPIQATREALVAAAVASGYRVDALAGPGAGEDRTGSPDPPAVAQPSSASGRAVEASGSSGGK